MNGDELSILNSNIVYVPGQDRWELKTIVTRGKNQSESSFMNDIQILKSIEQNFMEKWK